MQLLLSLSILLAYCGWGALGQTPIPLHFSFFTSFSGSFDSAGSIPAVDLAISQIESLSVLPGYRLVRVVGDTMCDRTTSLDAFFDDVLGGGPDKIAVVGSGCSVATEPVAEIIHQWNISQVSYASSATGLTNRRRFPNLFRTYPSDDNFIPAIRTVIVFNGWKRVAFLTQEENLFLEAPGELERQLEERNITVISRRFATDEDPVLVPDLFVSSEDYRVFFINTYADPARQIICEAYRRGFTYPRYAWITYGWYQEEWWTARVSEVDVPCTDDQLASFLDRVTAIQIFPTPDDPDERSSDIGITTNEFNTMYSNNLTNSDFNFTFVATLAYDAIWTLALALNKTSMVVAEGDSSLPGTGCENEEGALVPLKDVDYSNALMGCIIREKLNETDFVGVSGRVQFDSCGSRIQSRVRILQYMANASGFPERVLVAFATGTSFMLADDVTLESVFPLGVPPDGTPIDEVVTYKIGLVVVYDFLALAGIVFSLLCLTFNIVFRNRKVVRLTSPKLNYFIIAGCLIMYCSVFIHLIPSTSESVNTVRCFLQLWLTVVGYTIAFGTLLAKMGRIFHIFSNPTSKKRVYQDWHLFLAITALTGFALFLLLIGSAVPPLRPTPGLDTHEEDPTGKDDLGVRINFLSWQCYADSDASFIWLGVIFIFLLVLQIIGIVLAFQTRKVKVKVLNDSKYVAALIYIASIVLVIIGLVSVTLGSFINVHEGLLSGGILTLSTMFLILLFVPKMVSLYLDPTGEKIFDKSNPTASVEAGRGGSIMIRTSTNSKDSQKIAMLEGRVTELETLLSDFVDLESSTKLASTDTIASSDVASNGKGPITESLEKIDQSTAI